MGNANSGSKEVSRADGMGHPATHKASDQHYYSLYDVYTGGQEYQSCGPRGQCAGIIGSPVTFDCGVTYLQETDDMLATQEPSFMYEYNVLANYRATNNQRMVPGTCGEPPEPNQRLCYHC